jgi:5-carboxymethyl-2-hydroxymuconate isomerase
MPHFIIDCSANTLTKVAEPEILTTVFNATQSSGLFAEEDIKVRVNPYVRYEVGGKMTDFIHVFGYILEGRTDEQIRDLSQRIVKSLVDLFPDVEFVASSIDEFTKAGYCNRHLLPH